MISMFTAIARLLRRTEDNIATPCDLLMLELKHEVLGEAFDVPPHLLNQALRLHAIEEAGQMLIEHDLSTPDDEIRFSIGGSALDLSDATFPSGSAIRQDDKWAGRYCLHRGDRI